MEIVIGRCNLEEYFWLPEFVSGIRICLDSTLNEATGCKKRRAGRYLYLVLRVRGTRVAPLSICEVEVTPKAGRLLQLDVVVLFSSWPWLNDQLRTSFRIFQNLSESFNFQRLFAYCSAWSVLSYICRWLITHTVAGGTMPQHLQYELWIVTTGAFWYSAGIDSCDPRTSNTPSSNPS